MTHSRFEHDTAVMRIGDNRYQATVDAGWAVIDGAAPNGGYVMAIGARAMIATVPHHDPVTLTAHFLAPPQPGPVDIDVEVVRVGRRHSTVTAVIRQEAREVTRLIGAFGNLDQAAGFTRNDRRPPVLPPREECLDATQATVDQAAASGTAPPPIFQRLEHRMPAELMGWATGQPTGRGETGGYLRWPDLPTVDVLGLLVVADCYPPAVFNLGGSAPVGWVPTIELTVHLRKRPAEGWLSTWFTTTAVTNGYLEEDGEVWDADGDLVALSRQLALMPRR